VDTSRHGDGCDTPAGDSELTTAGIGEMLPGVLPPLWWDVNSFLVEEALRDILGRLGALPAGRHGTHEFVRRVAGRAALDLDLLKAAAAALPGASEAELERQYFGAAPTGSGPGPSTPRWRHLRHQARAAAVARGTAGEVPVVLDAVARLTADPAALTDLDDHDLLAYRRRLLDLGARAMTVELAVAAAAVAAYRRLELTIARHLGAAAGAAYAQRVTAGAGGAPRPQPGMSRAVFAGPTWADGGAGAPPPGRAPAADPLTGRRALEHRLRTPKWRRTRLLTGQVVDVRIHALRRLITETAAGLDNRELVKAAVLALGGEVRRVHLEIGRRLAARGAIEQVEDVDLLRDAGLAPALAGRVPPRAELDRRRRWVRRWRAEPPLPERFTGLPDRRPAPVPGGLDLRGLAASPGRHAGRARVVTDPIADRFDPDDVLVAVATDAGWSPLFLRAAAIVTERGGPLSHAAIVARELGVPAVLSVAGATAALAGRMVTVDGDAGTVTVHPDPERLP
jgi:pyruvate,water dikinase